LFLYLLLSSAAYAQLQPQTALYQGSAQNCNAGIVSTQSNYSNCSTTPVGHTIDVSSAQPADQFTLLYVGVVPGVNQGIVSTNPNNNRGASNPIGYVAHYAVQWGTPLYVGQVPNCNAGIVSADPTFKGCQTQFVGYTVP